jgi:ferredoxin
LQSEFYLGNGVIMKIPWVDQDACVCCGLCVNNIPEVFHRVNHWKSEVFDPDGAYEKRIQQDAIDICPAACIQWIR